MSEKDIAAFLYYLIADMDAADYAETKETELQEIADDLEAIKGTTLYNVIEEIAEINA